MLYMKPSGRQQTGIALLVHPLLGDSAEVGYMQHISENKSGIRGKYLSGTERTGRGLLAEQPARTDFTGSLFPLRRVQNLPHFPPLFQCCFKTESLRTKEFLKRCAPPKPRVQRENCSLIDENSAKKLVKILWKKL